MSTMCPSFGSATAPMSCSHVAGSGSNQLTSLGRLRVHTRCQCSAGSMAPPTLLLHLACIWVELTEPHDRASVRRHDHDPRLKNSRVAVWR